MRHGFNLRSRLALQLVFGVLFVPAVLLATAETAQRADASSAGREPIAAPRIIMFYGAPLERPVYLTDWHDNLRLFLSLGDYRSDTTLAKDAPRIQVALFWHGPTWERYLANDSTLATLPIDKAVAAQFVPATTNQAAMFISPMKYARPISAEGRAILAKHGLLTERE